MFLVAFALAQVPIAQEHDYAEAMRAVAANSKARPGVVLHVGDSITYANPYGQWARGGTGHTDADKAALKWMHANSNDDTDGWYLARFDHPDGGRSHTACSGIRLDELLAGGVRKMPPLAKILETYRPAAVVLMIGTNDVSARRKVGDFRADYDKAVTLMIGKGVVPIVSTIPPHPGQPKLAAAFNDAIREVAKKRSLPLIDFDREILSRRPDDWDGTLMAKGDVHPSVGTDMVKPTSAPTAENLKSSGYLLRGWLSVRKLAEVKAEVFDAP